MTPGNLRSTLSRHVRLPSLHAGRRLKLKQNNFGFLLAGLVSTLIAGPLLREFSVLSRDQEFLVWLMESAFSLMVLIGVWSLQENRGMFRLGLLLGMLSLLFPVLAWRDRSPLLGILEVLVFLLFCVSSCYLAAKHVFRGKEADINRLSGSVCVFLLIGFIWGFLYILLTMVRPGAFQGLDLGESMHGRYDELLYFSFATLTTLGYGDITPATPLARILSILEVLCGQFYLTILVASLVGNFLAGRIQR
ncbi:MULTISPECIES: potassium channel family protein [Methylococcus]|uniref:Potassium channel family protein n=1 Tax=Methylococcus capsulatus TaxID=414 RepID=A0ABZ2F1R2_METCP|nr:MULTISPECIES: potassium channel family protein [Methylococcus]MDF9391429.1 two pore domain potassium channel family protein [Methylococcus capsulatus]